MMLNFDAMSDDEVVASYVPQRYLLFFILFSNQNRKKLVHEEKSSFISSPKNTFDKRRKKLFSVKGNAMDRGKIA